MTPSPEADRPEHLCDDVHRPARAGAIVSRVRVADNWQIEES